MTIAVDLGRKATKQTNTPKTGFLASGPIYGFWIQFRQFSPVYICVDAKQEVMDFILNTGSIQEDWKSSWHD